MLHVFIVLEGLSSIYEDFLGNVGKDLGHHVKEPGKQNNTVLFLPSGMMEK